MAKKAAKADDSRTQLEASPPDTQTAISKAEAVRRMLSEGIDNPTMGSNEIKKRFGIEVTPQHFSATKAQQKSKQAIEKLPRGRKPASVAQLDQVVKTIQPKMGSGVVADLAAVKALVEKLGVDEVVEIAKLFG